MPAHVLATRYTGIVLQLNPFGNILWTYLLQKLRIVVMIVSDLLIIDLFFRPKLVILTLYH